jgi:Fe-S-cluster-containing dehydrogenase component
MNVEVKPSRNQRLYFMTLPCMQCEKPACAASCPTNAIYKREKDGVVLIDKAKCIGCQYCLHACPYGAINFDKDNNVADKCTYCAHKLDRGEQPACVSKCPGFSLDLKRKEDLVKETGLEGRKVKDTDRFRTNPSTFYVERLKP